jgi:hypothetical protein
MSMKEHVSWKKIVSAEDFDIVVWFYKKILPEIFRILGSSFQEKKWRDLNEALNYMGWLGDYEKPLQVVNTVDEKALGVPFPVDDSLPEEKAKSFIQMLKSLKAAIGEGPDQARLKETVEYLLAHMIPFRLQMFVGINQVISLIKFHEQLQGLMERARKADDDAMFKLVKLDKSFLAFEPIAQRIRVATLQHDTWFFYHLARAIDTDYYKQNLSKYKDDLAIYLFWYMWFYKTTISVFDEFLNDLGLESHGTLQSFKKRLYRLGLTKSSRKKTPSNNPQK